MVECLCNLAVFGMAKGWYVQMFYKKHVYCIVRDNIWMFFHICDPLSTAVALKDEGQIYQW